MHDRERAIAHYHQHIANVKTLVPADRLLIFSVDQGWEPLCQFLDVPVPATEFPKVNDRAAIQQTLKAMTRGAYIILGLVIAIVAVLIYLLFKLLL